VTQNNYAMNRSQRGERESGTALMVALVITMALAIIIGASLTRCMYTWNELGRNYHHVSALYAAESGVEKTLYALNHKEPVMDPSSSGFQAEMEDLTGLESVTQLSGTLLGSSGEKLGGYNVVVETDPTNERRAIITSQGMVPPEEVFSESRETRTIRVVVEMPPEFPEFERRLNNDAIFSETYILTNGETSVSGNTISGELVMDMDDLADPHIRITENLYEYWDEETESVQTAYGEVSEGFNMDEDTGNDVYLPFDEYTLEQYKEIAEYQGYLFDYQPAPEELPTTFFQEDGITPNVVFITSSIHLSGGYTIGGLVFIVGDVVTDPLDAYFGGNNLIEGIVYTTGRFWGHGGGGQPFNVNGAVFAQAVDIRGNTAVNYEWRYYHAMMDPPKPPPKYRFASWQELIGSEEVAGIFDPVGFDEPVDF
jgi:hypothetical protein